MRLGAWQHHSELGMSQGCWDEGVTGARGHPSSPLVLLPEHPQAQERINVPEGNVIYFFPCTGRRRSQYPRP